MAACANCRISAQLLEHAQIPELRCVVQVRYLLFLEKSPREELISTTLTLYNPQSGTKT